MTKRKRSWFWPIQICCWLLISFLNWLAQYSSGSFNPFALYINLSGLFIGGITVSSLYRLYLKKRKDKLKIKPLSLIGFLLVSAVIQAIVWMLILVAILMVFNTEKSFKWLPILYNIVPLALIMLAWDLAYLGYYLIRRYHQAEVEKWQMEAAVKEAQLGELRSQINPHFLFNALNNIRALILEDPQQARQMLTKFSEIFRHAIYHAEGRQVRIADEVNILRQYLDLMKIQYEDRLRYTITLDQDCERSFIPPMILQLLVENAVKHGIALQADGGLIAVDIRKNVNGLMLSVRNTGSLAVKSTLENSTGIGLANMKTRLELIYGDKAFIHIEEQQPFVIVTVNINT